MQPTRQLAPPVRASEFLVVVWLVATLATGAHGSSAEDSLAFEGSQGVTADRFHATDAQVRGLIETLLAESPRLESAWARSRSGFERVAQARSLPDPWISYRLFARSPETRVGPQEHMLEVSQGIPWAGKRSLQARTAEELASGSTWEAEHLERQLVSELKRAYFEAAYLQEALIVNSEERELLARFEGIALTKYSTGQGIQQTVVKVQTEISRLRDRETELRERLRSLTRHIAELTGRPEASLILEPIRLPLPDARFDREAIEQQAASEHPSVLAVERRVEADRLWTKRRSLDSRPDFRFGLGYTLVGDRDDPAGIASPPPDNGQDILALTVGVNIPIYRKRIRAGVAEARESERASGRLLESVRDRLRYDVQKSFLRLDASVERGRLYRDVIILQAEESLASAEAAYSTHRLDFLDLLDAERVLFQSRLAYHRLVADLWIALADLELATAQPIPTVGKGHDGSSKPMTGKSK